MGRSAGSNYWWNDNPARKLHYKRVRQIVTKTAQRGAEIAKSGMQESSGPIGQDTSEPGEYPAKQTDALHDAIDSEFFYETSSVIAARFGVYGQAAQQVPPEWAKQGSTTPVGKYAYLLETGAPGINMEPRPWLSHSMEQLIQEGWQGTVLRRGATMTQAPLAAAGETWKDITA